MTWRDMKDAPRDGTQILAARHNDCFWEFDVVWWSYDPEYPWQSSLDGGYPEGRLDLWQHIELPDEPVHKEPSSWL